MAEAAKVQTVIGEKALEKPRIGLEFVWAIVPTVLISALCLSSQIGLEDLWWHLRLGEEIVRGMAIPATDDLSFTAKGAPFIYQQWLGQAGLYLTYRLGGLELLLTANAVAFGTVAAIMLWMARRRTGSVALAAVAILPVLLLVLPGRGIRPQVPAFVLFAVFYLLLWRQRQGQTRTIWLLPVLEAVWVNTHGSAVLGPALCLLTLAGETLQAAGEGRLGQPAERRRLGTLAAVTVASLVAMVANPWGPGIFGYMATIGGSEVIRDSVSEWAPPTVRDPVGAIFFGLVLVYFAAFALSGRRLRVTDLFLFGAFLALSLHARRNMPWFAIVAGPIGAGALYALATEYRPRAAIAKFASGFRKANAGGRATQEMPARVQDVVNGLLCMAMLGALVFFSPWVRTHLPLGDNLRNVLAKEVPVAAVRYIGENLGDARLYHDNMYGAYLIWATPRQPEVFVDTRIELYSEEVWQDYKWIANGFRWQQIMAKYGIEYAVVPKKEVDKHPSPIRMALSEASDWRILYEDETAVVYGLGK